ncbi:MAG: tryptophan--tRNA ligase [Candidatus Portnoybacteria bacterium]|nr:tryptophan--tRNA ligase [Candidatus Portnoybacteria bacterium]
MRILSGVQPTGKLHIGNYLGAIKQWADLQNQGECFFLIVDLHAITVPYKPEEMQKNIINTAIDYLASGIDSTKSNIFIQSKIKEHTELAWLLETITPMGELERMTQYKEKSEKSPNAGIFSYPVLMAADILLYKTNVVPVGEDQTQHVELARKLAKKFNNQFQETFPMPKAKILKTGARIMSLDDPSKKMSKTGSPQSYICLSDPPKEIEKKIKKATTDSGKEIRYEPKTKPALANLINIYHLFSNKPIKEIEGQYKNKGYAEFKKGLTETIIQGLKPIQEKRKEYEKDPEKIQKILTQGKEKAEIIARKTIREAKTKMGL